MDSIRPFESSARGQGPYSNFWDVKETKNDPLVLDSWRHRQVSAGGMAMSQGIHSRSLGTLDATLSSLREEKRQAHTMQHSASQQQVNLGEMNRSAFTGMDLSAGGVLHPQQSIAELSERRREAIKAAFRRVDLKGQGWASVQDIRSGLHRVSNLPDYEKERVAHALSGRGDGSTRVPFATFAAYYQFLGSSIERDRDFEDLLRHHWGFSEVSDILEDMKNKFAMVGLAYAFRRSLESGSSPELGIDAFQQAIGHVGMQYSNADIRRLFDAFSPETAAHGGTPTLEVLRLTQHLMSAPRPPEPLGGSGSLPAGAHISEVHSEAGHQLGLEASMHSLGGFSPMPSHKEARFGFSKHHDLPLAPPEGGEGPAPSDFNAPLVLAPPEDTHDPLDETPQAPPERDAMGKLPLTDTTEAPPEDDGGEMAPEETDAPDPKEEMPQAPRELDLLSSYGQEFQQSNLQQYESFGHQQQSWLQPTHSSFGQATHQSYSSTSSPSRTQENRPVILRPTGQRRAVTVGINYIGAEYALSGCINDSDTFISLLTEDFGFAVSDIRQLRDDHPQRMPTRKNITAALHWLVKHAQPGDHLFFHYSGHGSQQQDTSGDEVDGKDETIVPCDFRNQGMLSDDDLRRMLVEPLPKGCRLTVVMDCCHSGTGMDLAYKAKVDLDGNLSIQKKSANKLPRPADGEVVMISGCKDNQTSADIRGGVAGDKAAGAMTTAFKTVISKKKDATYHQLLLDMRHFLKQNNFKQVPQLCMEFHLNFMEPFLPEACPPVPSMPSSPLRVTQRRALTIGINYLSLQPGQGRLSGCINDSETIISVLKDVFQFNEGQICRLRDDRANMMPTKANILAHMQWLTQGAGSGDELFLHYSGHGGRQRDTNGDEIDGMDDTLIPCDFQTAGQITDDVLYNMLVEHLPQGCRMWVIFDCCHSGTALDLPFKAQMGSDGRSISCAKTRTPFRRPGGGPVSQRSQGEVIMISGCKDDQTSADVQNSSLAPKASGAMTTAFRHMISPTISCEDLLTGMRGFLKRNNFEQVPQMSSDQFIQLDCCFVNYEAKQRNKEPTVGFVHQQMAAQRSLGRDLQVPMMQVHSPMPGSPMPGSPMHGRSSQDVDSRIQHLEVQIQQLRQDTSPMRGATIGPPSVFNSPMLYGR